MWRQIKLLTALELRNLYGINVYFHTKDKQLKKKNTIMAITIGLVFLVLAGYVCGLCYGLVIIGAADILPAYLITISSIITLMLNIFKTGSVIFRRQGYEIMSALPLSKWSIVCSRFFRLYIENMAIVMLIMVPGIIIYGIFATPGISFYLIGILVMLIIPLFPVTVASAIGALLVAISSRTKYKALVEAGLSVLLVVGVMMLTTNLPQNGEEFTIEMFQNIEKMVTEALETLFPPAIWLGEAMVSSNMILLGITATIYLAIFGVVVSGISVNFHKISRRLYGTSAKHNYEMERLQENSIMKALVIREARRYFASGVYVANTIIGPIMGTVLCIALIFMDVESITKSIPVAVNLEAALPFALAAMFMMLNPASISVSMEGKEVWILKTLPLDKKTILNSKILFNLLLCTPFYIVAVIALTIALRPDTWELIGFIIVPVIAILFAVTMGVVVNLSLPKMAWESEAEVVKQSAAAMLGGISGALILLICAAVVALVPGTYTWIAVIGAVVLLVTGFMILYCKKIVM